MWRRLCAPISCTLAPRQWLLEFGQPDPKSKGGSFPPPHHHPSLHLPIHHYWSSLLFDTYTSPSPNGLGYPGIPGLFNQDHVKGWKLVTQAVHAKGMRAHTQPHAMTQADIDAAVAEFVHAAKLAIEAGFDGVELHAANGYLIEQFLNANVNTRTDGYGRSAVNRNRFALEVARATVAAIGANRVGIRLSPYGVFNGTGAFAEVDAQYEALVKELSAMGLMYVHVLDHSAMGAPAVPAALKATLRAAFKGTFILAGGFDHASAEAALAAGQADLIGFGRPFLCNPDLVARMQAGAAMNAPDMGTFYTPGEKGYTDYPALSA